MRNRLIALALLAAAIVVLAVIFAQRGGHKAPNAVPLTTLAPAGITRVVAKKLGQPLFTLRRHAGHWEVHSAHTTGRADPANVRILLAALVENTARHYPVGAIDLAKAGLDPPAYTLEAGGVRLDFGNVNPTTLLRYVRRGDTVYAVMDHIAPLIANGAGAFLAASAASAPHAGTAGG